MLGRSPMHYAAKFRLRTGHGALQAAILAFQFLEALGQGQINLQFFVLVAPAIRRSVR